MSTVSAPLMVGSFAIAGDVERFSPTFDGGSLGVEGFAFVACALVCFVEPGAAA